MPRINIPGLSYHTTPKTFYHVIIGKWDKHDLEALVLRIPWGEEAEEYIIQRGWAHDTKTAYEYYSTDGQYVSLFASLDDALAWAKDYVIAGERIQVAQVSCAELEIETIGEGHPAVKWSIPSECVIDVANVTL